MTSISERTFHLDVFKMPPRMDAATLAETERMMPNTHRLWSYVGFEFFREPTKAASDLANIHTVVIQSCAQIGKTELLCNILFWIIRYDTGDVLYLSDTQKTSERVSKKRFKPFLQNTVGIADIRAQIKDGEDKSKSTFLMSIGKGCSLILGSAKSLSDLASLSVRYLLCDEVARYETLKTEGSPIELATQRQLQGGRGMRLIVSTPTTEDCLITQEYRLGTCEEWGVICGSCGQHFVVEWDKIDWTDDDCPRYACPHCGEVFTEEQVSGFEHCYGAPTNPHPIQDDKGRICRSFQITSPNCPGQYKWKTLHELERGVIMKGDESALKSFWNTRIGLPYRSASEVKIDPIALMRSATLHYDDEHLPLDIEYLIAGCDVHPTAVYYALWGYNKELTRCYAITAAIFAGDVSKAGVWESLNDALNRSYVRDDGIEMKPSFAFLDSGGPACQSTLRYSLINPRVMPIKGWAVAKREGMPDPLIRRNFTMQVDGIKTKAPVIEISVDNAKDVFLQWSQFTLIGDQRIAVNMKSCFRESFFQSLCSEIRINGKWMGNPHNKNEMLDCWVYAYCAAHYYVDNYASKGKDKELLMRKKAEKLEEVKETATEKKPRKKAAVKKTVDDPEVQADIKPIKKEKLLEEKPLDEKVAPPVKKYKRL